MKNIEDRECIQDRNCSKCKGGQHMSDDCKNCGSYQLYLMVTSGKPYCYSGQIPCLNCLRFSWTQDNFTPIVQDA